jgi:hypothetical protein
VIALWVAIQREEMIPIPDAINADILCAAYRICEFLVARVLGMELHSYP